jgi:NAD-dependent SIR2 family protein deacetylase
MTVGKVAVLCHGRIRRVFCDGCKTPDRAEADVYALLDTGVLPVGRFTHCPHCDTPKITRPKGADDA